MFPGLPPPAISVESLRKYIDKSSKTGSAQISPGDLQRTSHEKDGEVTHAIDSEIAHDIAHEIALGIS
jgi:hypothetical protein